MSFPTRLFSEYIQLPSSKLYVETEATKYGNYLVPLQEFYKTFSSELLVLIVVSVKESDSSNS